MRIRLSVKNLIDPNRADRSASREVLLGFLILRNMNFSTILSRLTLDDLENLQRLITITINEKTKSEGISINKIDISIRLFNVLKNEGIHTLNQAADLTENDFFNLKNAGKRSFAELCQLFKDHGLKFKE